MAQVIVQACRKGDLLLLRWMWTQVNIGSLCEQKHGGFVAAAAAAEAGVGSGFFWYSRVEVTSSKKIQGQVGFKKIQGQGQSQ